MLKIMFINKIYFTIYTSIEWLNKQKWSKSKFYNEVVTKLTDYSFVISA